MKNVKKSILAFDIYRKKNKNARLYLYGTDYEHDGPCKEWIRSQKIDDARISYNEPIVKRVIATGNHYVKIDFNNSLVYVSDDAFFDEKDLINEREYAYFDIGRWRMTGTLETYVPEGKIFVMGDNRNNSADSRSQEIGLVDTRRILGKVVLRLFPVNKITLFD